MMGSNSNKSFETMCSEAIIISLIIVIWYYCRIKLYYTEREAAIIARDEKDFIHLRTNRGKLYRDTSFKHVIDKFIDDTSQPNTVSKMWIKTSPCRSCCDKLINFYKYSEVKPVLYMGEIRDEDERGMKRLLQSGFRLKIWRKLCLLMKDDMNRIKHSIHKLKHEAHNEMINKRNCILM
jgi:hypothetical protein